MQCVMIQMRFYIFQLHYILLLTLIQIPVGHNISKNIRKILILINSFKLGANSQKKIKCHLQKKIMKDI